MKKEFFQWKKGIKLDYYSVWKGFVQNSFYYNKFYSFC